MGPKHLKQPRRGRAPRSRDYAAHMTPPKAATAAPQTVLGDYANSTPRVPTAAFHHLAKLNHAGRWRDNYGNLCGGLNRTALLYHVPLSHYRAALCRRCTAAAPRLSCRQAARCLAAAARLDGVGLRDPALLAALAARTLRSAHRLRPAAVARLLEP